MSAVAAEFAPAPKAGPNGAGRRTRWMLRGAPESNVDKAERGYTAGRRLNPEEIAAIAAEMGLPVATPRPKIAGAGVIAGPFAPEWR
jgi:hypothetical protein